MRKNQEDKLKNQNSGSNRESQAKKAGNNGKQTELASESSETAQANNNSKPKEIGGVKWGEPTKYGDWQHKGRTSDF